MLCCKQQCPPGNEQLMASLVLSHHIPHLSVDIHNLCGYLHALLQRAICESCYSVNLFYYLLMPVQYMRMWVCLQFG